MFSNQDNCPSCEGTYYHYAGCGREDHGTVIVSSNREKWYLERMGRLETQMGKNYDFATAAMVRGNEV